MYQQAAQASAPANPLSTVQGYVGIANAIQQNRLMQQEQQSNSQNIALRQGEIQAQQIMSKHRNDDGTFDVAGATAELKNNPLAYNALQHQNQLLNSQEQTGLNAQNQPVYGAHQNVLSKNNPFQNSGQQPQTPGQPNQETVDKLHNHLDTVSGILTPLASDPDVNQKKIIDAVSDGVAHPDADFSATEGASILSQLPNGPGGAPATSQQLQPLLQQKLQQVNQNKSMLSQKYPSSDQLAKQRQNAADVAAGFAQPRAQAPAAGVGTITQVQMTPMSQDLQGQQPQEQSPNQPPQSNQGQQSTQTDNSGVVHPQTVLSPPPGWAENQQHYQQHYQQVQHEADNVGQAHAVLQNIYNLSKAGAPTGTISGKIYQYLAEKGLATPGIQEAAVQNQEIAKSMAQYAVSMGMPDTDKQLGAVQSAITHPDQLPQAIQELIPSLEAFNDTKGVKAQYYRKVAGSNNGGSPTEVAKAESDMQSFDPRLLLMQNLHDSNPAEFKKYVSGLGGDKGKLQQQYRDAVQKGILSPMGAQQQPQPGQ